MKHLSRLTAAPGSTLRKTDQRNAGIWTRFLADEGAVTAIEYALIASLVAIVALVGIALLGVNLGVLWDRVADRVVNAFS